MKFLITVVGRFGVIASILTAILGLASNNANASLISAVWTGHVTYVSGTYNVLGPVSVSDSIRLRFLLDPSLLGPAHPGSPGTLDYETYGAPGMYKQISVSIGSNVEVVLTDLMGSEYGLFRKSFGIPPTLDDVYLNRHRGLIPGAAYSSGIDTQFAYPAGHFMTTDPTQTFSLALPSTGSGADGNIQLLSGNAYWGQSAPYDPATVLYINASWSQLDVTAVGVVPEPSTYFAGALVIVPVAAQLLRNFRKTRVE